MNKKVDQSSGAAAEQTLVAPGTGAAGEQTAVDPGYVRQVLQRLDDQYGTQKKCSLNYQEPWQLLIAVILSAQCTDARVNMVTGPLFERYPAVEDLANARQQDVEQYIHSAGFYVNKSKNIIACCKRLSEVYGGRVPDTMEDLTSLAGVGRKTANVILGNIYDVPSIVVDTHVKRISYKLGFTKQKEPEKIEYDLMKVLPKDHWIIYNMHIITLGRQICIARNPKCGNCFLKDLCPSVTILSKS